MSSCHRGMKERLALGWLLFAQRAGMSRGAGGQRTRATHAGKELPEMGAGMA